ncbi:MAG: hypothetical protein ABUK01_06410 [Leptospirales bacterium]
MRAFVGKLPTSENLIEHYVIDEANTVDKHGAGGQGFWYWFCQI